MRAVYHFSALPPSSKIFSFVDPSFKKILVVCDKKLKTHSLLKKWLKDPSFLFYFVSSGEKSKSFEESGVHLKKIKTILDDSGQKHVVFVSLGGGSVGDLTGFLSSIYRRGMPLIHIPTTYLSSLDSAHGGKTALNFQRAKNFVGTYHFPKAVFIVRSFFQTLSQKQKKSAYGEVLKMALIRGGRFYKKICKYSLKDPLDSFIKPSIKLKMKIVKKDPYEKKNLRKILNFGHTIGHILEARLSLTHGEAVLHGLLFSVEWSYHKKYLTQKQYLKIKKLIPIKTKQISASDFKKSLTQDKKYKSKNNLDFVFIKKPGSVFIKSVSERDLIKEAKRQKVI